MHKVFATVAVGVGAFAMFSGTAFASDAHTANPAPKPEPKVHVVAAGDSLSIIADAEKLDSWRQLWNANADLTDPNLIHEGDKLIVPQGPTVDRPLPVDAVSAPVQSAPEAPQAAAPRAYAPQPRRVVTAANYSAGAGGVLAHIRAGESGGNYATNTGNGYYGAYQFNLGTWRGVGGTGLPSDASPAEQDMRAQMLYNQRGCSPWPQTCR